MFWTNLAGGAYDLRVPMRVHPSFEIRSGLTVFLLGSSLFGASCSVSRASAGSSQRATVDGFLGEPGMIRVYHRELTDVGEAAVESALASYGLNEYELAPGLRIRGCSLSIVTDSSNRLIQRRSVCHVGNGHERFWIDILSKEPSILKVEPEPITVAMVGVQSLGLNFRPAATRANLSAGQTPLAQVIDFFTKRFAGRGVYRPTGRSTNHASFVVEQLRTEVLRNARLWEQLEIHVVITADQPPHVSLLVDGRYAPGVGSRPPAENAYLDMASNYQKDLTLYVNGLVDELHKHFGIAQQ
jgi:hypothetical protein